MLKKDTIVSKIATYQIFLKSLIWGSGSNEIRICKSIKQRAELGETDGDNGESKDITPKHLCRKGQWKRYGASGVEEVA